MKDKHIEAFKQEAFELLEVLESSLIDLETNPGDEELIGKVFRSLHTLKGSGGMFGFDDIAAFVHDIETVYDRIRNHQLTVNDRIIDITLKAGDHLLTMLKREKQIALKDDAEAKEIISYFKEFFEAEPAQTKVIDSSSVNMQSGNEMAVYYILFEPNEDLFLKGTKPIGLLKELEELGDAVIIPKVNNVPSFKDINPEKLYTSWEIILSTDRGIDSIKDVFIFVEDDCKIIIQEIDKGKLKGNTEFYKSILKSKNDNVQDEKNSTEKLKKETVKANALKTTDKKIIKNESLSSIRVSSIKLDKLVDLVGELVTVQARLTEIAGKNNNPDLVTVSEDVERLTWELRENVLNIRMLPIGSTFNKFNRLVRDLSKDLGKEVELITAGGETCYTQIVRCCLHGVTKEIRLTREGLIL